MKLSFNYGQIITYIFHWNSYYKLMFLIYRPNLLMSKIRASGEGRVYHSKLKYFCENSVIHIFFVQLPCKIILRGVTSKWQFLVKQNIPLQEYIKTHSKVNVMHVTTCSLQIINNLSRLSKLRKRKHPHDSIVWLVIFLYLDKRYFQHPRPTDSIHRVS